MTATEITERNQRRAQVGFQLWVEGLDQAFQKWSIADNALKPALLLSGPALTEAEGWLMSHEAMLSKSQKAFVFKSIMQRSAEHLSAQEQAARARRDKRIWWADFALSSSAVVLTILFPILLKFAVTNMLEAHRTEVAQEKAIADAARAAQLAQAEAEAAAEDEAPTAGPIGSPRHTSRAPRSPADIAMELAAQSRYLTPIVQRAIEDNDTTLAQLLAIEALPDENAKDAAVRQRPLLPEATAGLFRTLRTFRTLSDWHQPDRVALTVTFCQDGERILTATEEPKVQAWDIDAALPVGAALERPERLQAVAFDRSCDRFVLSAAEHSAEIRDLQRPGSRITLAGHEADVIASAFNRAGDLVVTAAQDETARIWSARTGRTLFTLREHGGIVRSAVFSPDDKRVLTASEDKTARLWDAASGRQLQVFRGHEGTVTSAIFSVDGTQVLTTSFDGSAAVWDAATGERNAVLRPDRASVLGAVFDPQGKRVLTTSQGKTAQVWDAATGELISVLGSHGDQVRAARFSPDGAWIVTTTWNGEARLWQAATGSEIAELHTARDHIEEFTFREHGHKLLAITSAGALLEWPLMPSLQATIDHVKATVPKCLAPGQRQIYALDTAPPDWCVRYAKPPYDHATIEGALAPGAHAASPAAAAEH